MENKVYVDGADIQNANPSVDPTTDRKEIHYTLNKKGADDFYNLSVIASQENRFIAIVLDRKIVSVLSCRETHPRRIGAHHGHLHQGGHRGLLPEAQERRHARLHEVPGGAGHGPEPGRGLHPLGRHAPPSSASEWS